MPVSWTNKKLGKKTNLRGQAIRNFFLTFVPVQNPYCPIVVVRLKNQVREYLAPPITKVGTLKKNTWRSWRSSAISPNVPPPEIAGLAGARAYENVWKTYIGFSK